MEMATVSESITSPSWMDNTTLNPEPQIGFLNGFCNDQLWSNHLLLDSSWPHLTACFQFTVLTYLPFAVLWLSTPFYLFALGSSKLRPLPISCLSAVKLMIASSLAIISLIFIVGDLGSTIHTSHDVSMAEYSSFLIRCLSYTVHGNDIEGVYSGEGKPCLNTGLDRFLSGSSSFAVSVWLHLAGISCPASKLEGGYESVHNCTDIFKSWLDTYNLKVLIVFLLLYERRRHVTTAALPLVIWFLLVLCDVVPLYTRVMIKEYDISLLKFCLFAFLYGLEVLMLLLHLVADNHGIGHLPPRTSPQVTASYASHFFYFWITRTVFRGWRKDLEEKDLFDIHPVHSTKSTLPEFEEKWGQEIAKCRKKRLKQIYRVEKKALATSVHSLQLTGNNEKDLLVSHVNDHSYNTMDLGKGRKQKKIMPSLLKVLWKFSANRLITGFLQKTLADGLQLLTPLFLSLLIAYSENAGEDFLWKGYALAGLILVGQMLRSVVFNGSFWQSQTVGMDLKTIIIGSIYRKALTMSNEAKKESTIGEIVSLMSVDCQRVQDCMNVFFIGFTAPLQVIGVMIILYYILGVSIFAGMLVLLLTVPLNSFLAARQQSLQRQNLKLKDARLRLTNEALSGMKVLKLYAWELTFQKKINDLRNREAKTLLHVAYINMIISICFNIVPFLVTLATFAVYVNISEQNILDPSKAFVSLSFFSILRVPLTLISTVISMSIQALVSIGRVNKFLCTGDLDPENITKKSESEFAVEVDRATFTWDREVTPALRNVSMKVSQGQLFAVVGQVGSGKSSLMSALLGEMERLSGTASLTGSVAYVPQQAWIQNASVRDNILFGKPYNQKRYTRVIQACALERDFEILAAGDQTEIGEKGINLSGGQKQRVSLARAVYSGADIYVFDDPLSAVDSHVGKHIFNKVISHKSCLKGKTRILVTHGIHWLPMVDKILVMEDGSVTETGSYEDLMTNNGPFAQFIRTYLLNRNEDDDDDDPDVRAMKAKVMSDYETLTSDGLSSDNELLSRATSRQLTKKRRKTKVQEVSNTFDSLYPSSALARSQSVVYDEDSEEIASIGKLVSAEKVYTGKVKYAVFGAYAKAAGTLPILFSILMFGIYQVSSAMANFWLADWSKDVILNNASMIGSNEFDNKQDYYLIVFGLFGVGQVVFITIYNVIYWIRMVIAAKNLHTSMLASILRSPMAFFDTTPLGRIMNRFSRDIEVVDNTLPIIIRDYISTLSLIVVTIIIISINTPLFLIMMGPICLAYISIQAFYISTSRQLKRLESVTRSPIYSHFSETITGGAVIRAYGVTDRFVTESNSKVDRNQALYYASLASNRWLGANLDVLANLVVFGSALFAVLTPGTDGATIGLSVSYAIQASGSLVWMVRQMSDLETNIVSVERLKEYSELDSEADWVVPQRRPMTSWPEEGVVEFNQYKTKYRPGLDLVLKGITCKFKAGEKIGIVGRTGAGKSSLALALFRLIEADEGHITVDGITLGDIGLHDVRSRLTILPQDPVLFFGTVRMNLDPLEEYRDDELWEALASAHLGEFVKGLPGGLDFIVGEEGQSLSVGQRQLVCLARALLKNTKVLILDEATAAVDMETDMLIQNTIRKEFVGCTIITIAHRLNTIMDYDRIMVLDDGQIQEFDTPGNLLGHTESVFYSMAREANLV